MNLNRFGKMNTTILTFLLKKPLSGLTFIRNAQPEY